MEFHRELEGRLTALGLDLLQAFDAARYNEGTAGLGLPPLPLFGRAGAWALLIGNSRALWPPFTGAWRTRPELRDAPHPIDRYVSEGVSACATLVPAASELRFSHEGGSRFVSMLHLAEASGLAAVGPAHLAAHPTHGPWIALRAVLVVDAAPPAGPPAVREAPCRGCPAPCKEALDAAVATMQAEAGGDPVAPTWRRWVAVRDACPVGRESRYGEAQLRYHYTKDRAVLDQAPR